ncbi:MAG TPA: alpha/beta hydrolase [Devosiaceae bacterium]|jgi:phospholipase/carboxylesterase
MADYTYREQAGATPISPLLFVFHGTGGDENQFFALGQQLLPGARLIAPRGDVSEHGAARFFRRTGEGVYDMDDLRRATGKLAEFVATRAAESQPSAVYGLGYSNGANILAAVLFGQPQLFDGAVLMHPLIPFEPAAQPGLAGRKVLITGGARDPIAPASTTQQLADYFERQGSAVSVRWHEGGHELRQEELLAAQALLNGDAG